MYLIGSLNLHCMDFDDVQPDFDIVMLIQAREQSSPALLIMRKISTTLLLP